MDKYKVIIILISIFQLSNCQEMKNKKIVPSYVVQLSHSSNEHSVGTVQDSIITLEGEPAYFPFIHSSGNWGSSGKGSSYESGTPIGVDAVYYAETENAFYHLKVEFPRDKVIDWVQRAYAIDEPKSSEVKLTTRYINRKDEPDFDRKYNDMITAYQNMTDLIFGFAPKGYVVVWLGYGPTQIELGAYQAELVTDEKKIKEYEKMYQRKYNISASHFDELAKRFYLPNQSSEKWKRYRSRHLWYPKMISNHKGFRAFRMDIDYYNGERETILRPWIKQVPMEARAIPREISFFWETGKGEAYEGRAFFDWEKTHEFFKNSGKQFCLEFRIDPDNNGFQLLINNQILKADSLRIYSSDLTFQDSYK